MDAVPFLEDIFPHNLLYAVTIRSPAAKGSLKYIQVPILPSNYAFITARNIPGENRLADTNIPILACENLSYIGEPVAIMLGSDKAKLEELAAKCKVAVDEETPVFSSGNNHYKPAAERELQIGNTREAFEKIGKIVAGSYKTGIQDHWYAEPVGAVTWFKSEYEENKEAKTKKTEKTLIVRTATQWPYHVKRSVSGALGIEPSAVSVEPTALNLHMDGKLWYPSLIACHAALGTLITKKPVRMILNRQEDFLFTPKRCNASIDIASTIDESGNITAAEIDISVNLGAYGVNSEEILDQVCLGSLGFYNIENLKLTAKATRTNIPPHGPFSGFGLAQGFFAMERHISQIADKTGQDPAQWRKNRINSKIILPPGQASKNSGVSGGELIDAAAKMSDYYRKWASYELLRQTRGGKTPEKGDKPRGVGIAAGFQGSGLLYCGEDNGYYSVEVTLTKESILEIKTSITSTEDYNKIWEKVASETMSIKPEMVRIVSKQSPDCGPSCASRNITAITKLVEKCCLAIRKQRFHNPLPITVRRSIKPQGGSLWNGRFTPPEGKVMDISGFSKPGMAAAVVEVAVDLLECIPKIRGVWLGVDGGKIISANRARRCLTRGAVQALGWAFTENLEYINGILPRSQYDNYAIFSPADIPPIHIDFLSSGDIEPKGIGELPFTCIPAAFMQAVSQAMDHCFKSIPLNKKDIWEMVRTRNVEASAQGLK
jgi:CO/xanthine dehydrogenase Mo-binding subunit